MTAASATVDRSQPVIECRDLVAGYGALPVLHEISLTVHPGEVVLLVGANGAGKSTTLLTLAGELPSQDGTVLLDGKPTKAALHRRAQAGLALVPEERSVFKGMTCRDNLRIGTSDVDRALELFPDLVPRLDVRGGLLSGGEQQMVSLGRALSSEPRVLLADELSLGLAPIIVDRLLRTIREAADRGCGVLLVEQHLRQAMEIADSMHVMRRGRIEMSGTASEFRSNMAEIQEMYLASHSPGRDIDD